MSRTFVPVHPSFVHTDPSSGTFSWSAAKVAHMVDAGVRHGTD
ncbi:MAG: hypothetical protein V4617_10060 [Gemmatimonadota bacterium]